MPCRLIICADCGQEKRVHSRGLCNTCYKRSRSIAVKSFCTQCSAVCKRKPRNELAACASCWKKVLDRRRYAANPKAANASNREWKQRNGAKVSAYARKHYVANKHKYREKDARRRAAELQATPKWVDRAALRAIYESCPKGYHVDHEIPLKHPDVCGLHVPANLRIIPASENLGKCNTFNGRRK